MAELIRVELAEILRDKMRDPRLEIADLTVTDVRVSRGLRFATVYFTCIGHDPEVKATALQVLRGASGFLRTVLAQRHSLRFTPELRFQYDEISERAARVDALLAESSPERSTTGAVLQ